MSGHNPPHGRLGQPNPTWNPLQVPSYIPRQPQLAHMSSERSLARSPLTWPPTHPDQLYSFMTGNHKNNLEMNPILQGYGRNAGMPLGSVDLSLSSASRSTPSPKGNVPVASPVTAQPVSSTLPPNIPSGLLPMAGDQTEQYLAKMATSNMNTNHTRSQSTNPSGGVIQSTAALKDRTHNLMGSGGPPGPGSYLNSSNTFPLLGNAGGNGFGANAANRTTCDLAAYVSSGLLIKDAKQINNEIGSKNGRECLPSLNVESSDLVKDILMQTMQSNAVSISPKRSSPLRTTILPSHSPGRSRSPQTDMMLTATDQPNSACVNSSFQELSSAGSAVPHTADPLGKGSMAGNVPVATGLLGAETGASGPLTAVSTSGTANPASPTNQSITSNEDSVDSNSSKSRRRRKPERTNKMNTEELDQVEDFFTGKNDAIDGLVEPLRPNIAVRSDITALALEGISALSQGFPGIQSDGSQSPHITDLSDSTRVNLHQQSHSESDRNPSRAPPVTTQPAPVGDGVADSIIGDGLSVTAATVVAAIESVRKESDSNSDDCETIDKIATMILSTENEGTTAAGLRQPEAKELSAASDASDVKCNGPLPPEHVDAADNAGKAIKEADPDSSYEEIENKLEEMFAGIEEPSGNSKPSPEKPNDAATIGPVENHTLAAQDILNQLSGEQTGGLCESPAVTVAGSTGKKPLTPAQKRGNGTKPAAAGTPPKRKKVLKKKPVGMSKPLFMDHGLPMGGGPGGSGKKTNAKNAGKKSGPNPGNKGKSKLTDVSITTCGVPVDANGKLKGPYVHIMADGSHNVINTPINEEDAEKAQNKPKKFANNSLANSERSKIRGLHVSTLSTKYDADTTDTSWMCVFCKTGPHRFRLGDLYGPYIISTESVEFEESRIGANFFSSKRTRDSLESRIAKETRVEQQKHQLLDGVPPKSKKRKNAIIAGAITAGGLGFAAGTLAIAGPSGSQKRQTAGHPAVDIFYGMTKVSDNSYEVWMHEDCLSWAPGVYVIGTRIVGLEAAIWNCCRHQCLLCSQHGAMLSCLHRGCTAEAHIVCARKNNWKTTAEFQSLCEQHGATAPAQPSPKPPAPSGGKGAELKVGHGVATGAPSS